MNFTGLRYFHEVAVSGSIRQAAEHVHVAASALSRQISKLEHEFGAPLLERRATGVVLTPAGRLLAQHTRTMFRDLQRLKEQVDDLRSIQRGEVMLSTMEGIVSDFLPETMISFLAQYPNVSFNILTGSSDSIMESVVSDHADIGITYNAKMRVELDVAIDYPLPCYAIVSPSHVLAKSRTLSVSEAFEHKIALPDSSFGLRRLIDAVAYRNELKIRDVLRTNSFELIKSFACTGHAIAILPKILVRREVAAQSLCAIPINDQELCNARMQICTHRNRALSSAALGFLEHTLASIRALPTPGPVLPGRSHGRRVTR